MEGTYSIWLSQNAEAFLLNFRDFIAKKQAL